MEEKLLRRNIRRTMNPVGWSLVVYYLLMNGAVMAVMFFQMAVEIAGAVMAGNAPDMAGMMESVQGNGWGYVLAVVIGLVILLCWKKPGFWKNEIWAKGRPMTVLRLLSMLVIIFGCQMVASLLATVLELLLNPLGLSVVASMESASPALNTFSMYLYVAILAPISEELLFRGLIQRLLMPYGKKIAIFCSAFLFGLFHGNLIQSPYAFLIGLVLGYVTAEHSILWAIVLHLINNVLMGDVLGKVTAQLPETTANLVTMGFFGLCLVGSILLLVFRSETVRRELEGHTLDKRVLGCFFTNPGVIVLMALMAANMIMMLFL